MKIELELTHKELENLMSSVKYSLEEVSEKHKEYHVDGSEHTIHAKRTLADTYLRYARLLHLLRLNNV